MSSYHGWTHRPKAQGGTDPVASGGDGPWEIKVFHDLQAVTIGNSKHVFMVPEAWDGMSLLTAEAFVSTNSSSGTPTVQLRKVSGAVDMLSTRITIDVGEPNSYTAAVPSVVDAGAAAVTAGALIAVDIDVAGTGAKGLGVVVEFG